MWADNETGEDLFGFRVHADLIRELIMDPTVLPATIGVYGDWGGGKSSMIKMLTEDFETLAKDTSVNGEAYKGVAVLYFNGWLFEGYDDAKAALLSAILTSLRDHQTFGPKIKKKAGELLKRVDYMRGLRMLLSGAVAGGMAAATGGLSLAAVPVIAAGALAGAEDSATEAGNAAIENTEKTSAEEIVSDVRTFRDDFEKMISESDIKTLVVFIDDLDRCSPERIIENLEAIKLFLNVPKTAFVIGADRRIIRQAVAWRYREALKEPAASDSSQLESSERLVDDYLEKLIQIPYRLPRLSPSEIETYLTLLFCKRHLSSEVFSRVFAEAQRQRTQDRYRAFNQSCALEVLKGTTVPAVLSESLQVGASISSQITDVLQGNPRQVKRFLNAFFLRRKLANVAKLVDVKDEVLVKLMLLEYKAPKLFEKLFAAMDGSSGTVALLTDLEARSERPADPSPATKDKPTEWQGMDKWLEMEPRLAGVDLRDYMWVTRDRLGSTMSGTTMVPPVVRAVLKKVLSEVGDVSGRRDIHTLQPVERTILAEQLVTHFLRKPAEAKAFQALLEIASIDTATADRLISLLKKVPAKDLSPAIGTSIRNSSKKADHLGQICTRIVGELAGDDSRFGKALKQK
jgi:predicted KAP-like P-loop ATPase